MDNGVWSTQMHISESFARPSALSQSQSQCAQMSRADEAGINIASGQRSMPPVGFQHGPATQTPSPVICHLSQSRQVSPPAFSQLRPSQTGGYPSPSPPSSPPKPKRQRVCSCRFMTDVGTETDYIRGQMNIRELTREWELDTAVAGYDKRKYFFGWSVDKPSNVVVKPYGIDVKLCKGYEYVAHGIKRVKCILILKDPLTKDIVSKRYTGLEWELLENLEDGIELLTSGFPTFGDVEHETETVVIKPFEYTCCRK